MLISQHTKASNEAAGKELPEAEGRSLNSLSNHPYHNAHEYSLLPAEYISQEDRDEGAAEAADVPYRDCDALNDCNMFAIGVVDGVKLGKLC